MSDGLRRNSFMGVMRTEIILACIEGRKYIEALSEDCSFGSWQGREEEKWGTV